MNERTTCYRTLGVQQDNSILSTELIVKKGHRKEFLKVTFRTFALRKSERRNCQLSVICRKWSYAIEGNIVMRKKIPNEERSLIP